MSATLDSHLLAEIPIAALKPGINLLQQACLILYLEDNGEIHASHNRCQHQGAKLVQIDAHTLRCPRHGWELDAASMCYRNPQGGVQQARLATTQQDGVLRVFAAANQAPWGPPPARPTLAKQECQLRFYAHACLEITAGGQRFFTDPWLQGPAFVRGWWLAQPPPGDWLAQLQHSDGVIISHSHSDHLNPPTLRPLQALRPDIPIYIPAFASGSCRRELTQLGFTNVHPCPFDTWIDFPGGLHLMWLQDQSHRDDSAMLFEYKGRRMFNMVDCHNLGPTLPRDIDVLLTQFAGGASGFPVCWEALLGRDKVAHLVQRHKIAMKRSVFDAVDRCRPAVYVPFANFFVEAHPADAAIRASNDKNTASDICTAVRDRFSGVQTWRPEPGGTLDLAHHDIASPEPATAATHDLGLCQSTGVHRETCREAWAMGHWIAAIEDDADFAPLYNLAGLQAYFDWAAYRGNLVLHVLETDAHFRETFRAFFVDFRSGQVHAHFDVGDAPYLRMHVRCAVFRHVLRRGLPWEEISIGFQARFYRHPDVYHFGFWNHFQNHLPHTAIPWPTTTHPQTALQRTISQWQHR